MSVAKALGEDKLSGAAEHWGLRRLRHRRLLAFLWLQGLEGTFGSLVDETDSAFLHVGRLQRLVQQGRWRDAIGYLSGFLPPDFHDPSPMSVEAQVLHRFLMVHRSLDDAGHDGVFAARAAAKHRSCDFKSHSHGTIRLRYMMLIALHAKDQLRARLDWELVRRKASDIVYDLVHKTPELKRAVELPAGRIKPHTVLPIRLISSRRSYYHKKNRVYRLSPSALANRYIRKRSLLSPNHSQEPHHELISKAHNWPADLIDESLKAGVQTEHHQEHPLQTGATSAPVSHWSC